MGPVLDGPFLFGDIPTGGDILVGKRYSSFLFDIV